MLAACPDSNFLFYDPPFYPDHDLSYPADWDHNSDYSKYLTTSTRESDEAPNPCGSGGGAKNWYDHIFLSSWIVNNSNYIKYIPHSYHTIGNDGKRFRIGVNNNNGNMNTAVPPEVADALYHFSNKYPVMLSLEVTSNVTGSSPRDPEIANITIFKKEEISVVYKDKSLAIHFPDAMVGEEIFITCAANDGSVQMKKKLVVKTTDKTVDCKLKAGSCNIKFSTTHNVISETNITVPERGK
jgi:hypothetical protein